MKGEEKKKGRTREMIRIRTMSMSCRKQGTFCLSIHPSVCMYICFSNQSSLYYLRAQRISPTFYKSSSSRSFTCLPVGVFVFFCLYLSVFVSLLFFAFFCPSLLCLFVSVCAYLCLCLCLCASVFAFLSLNVLTTTTTTTML